jgi:BlaI family penicillinase repressor
MTMMNILEDKGHLKRERAARAYVYLPTQPKSKVISSLVNNFLTKVFDGSAKPLVMNLLKERKLSETDLEEISAMIEEQR